MPEGGTPGCVSQKTPVVGRISVTCTDSGTYWTLVRQSPEGDQPPS
jgi:hypothetical protein